MAETVTKLPIRRDKTDRPSALEEWQPFESFREEVDRLVDDFGWGWRPFRRSLFAAEPFFRRELKWHAMPAVDVVESEKAYEFTAELPRNGREEHRGQSCRR